MITKTLVALSLLTISANAALIVSYDIPSSGTTTAFTSKNASVNASGITSGAAGQFTVSSSSGTAFLLFSNGGADLAASIAGSDYLQFTVSVSGATVLSLSDIVLSFKTEDAAVTSNLSVLASLNAFATTPVAGDAIGTVSTANVAYNSQSINITSPTFQNLTNSTVTLRIYGFDVDSADATKYIRIDNFALNGTVVPEPSSLAMGLGAMAFLGIFRRR